MKVVFANPPYIRSEGSCAENNFKVEGFVFKKRYRKIPGAGRIFRFLTHSTGLGRGIRYGVRAGSRWPWTMPFPHGGPPYPFFMGYAASYLKEHGHSVEILDAVANEDYDYMEFFKQVERQAPDIVVLECSTPTIDIDLWAAMQISRFAEVALAGPHLATSAEQIEHENPHIKYLLRGEYILSSLEMVESREAGIYESKIVNDLDSIPFPFREYKGGANYYDPTMPTAKPQMQIYASKGCPFKCTFCAWPQTMYKGRYSPRAPEMVAKEIRESVALHGYKSIFFDDDTFNLGTKRISKLCDHLKEIGIPWTMMGRLDASPDWLYDKMVDCGCVGMRFGIETFDLDVMKGVKKGLERTDFKNTLSYLEKYPKLMIHLTMMKYLPGQTEEIHQNDMRFLRSLGYVPSEEGNIYRNFQLSACAPFPGTEMYRNLVEEVGEDALANFKLYDGGHETVMKQDKE